jgi:hypothetical protein
LQAANRLPKLFDGSRDIGLVPRRHQCKVDIGRRNKSNGKVLERLDQPLSNVRSDFDADERAYGLGGDISAHHRSDGGYLHG